MIFRVGLEVQGDLFDTILVFENYPDIPEIRTTDSKWQFENLGMHGQNNYPLSVIVSAAETIKIHFRYNEALLDAVYVQKMREHFECVLLQIIESKADRLADIYLPEEKDDQWQNRLNISTVDYPKDKTVIDVFKDQVRLQPNETAFVFEEQRLTYRKLDERSDRLASYLRRKDVGEGSLVVIAVNRSPECIVGILGILKAGAAYVPIESAYPDERIAFILQDTASAVCIADGIKTKIICL